MTERDIPKGYIRKELRACKGLVNMPDTWFFNHAPGLAGHTFYLSRENLKKRGYFSIGATIMFAPGNALKALESQKGAVDAIFERMVAPYRNIVSVDGQEPQQKEEENFRHFTYDLVSNFNRAVSLPAFGNPDTINILDNSSVNTRTKISVNKDTGTYYLATFEAPSDRWEVWEPTGQTILDSLTYDPTI